MFTKEMVDKIDSFLRDNLDIMFKFEFNGLLLLCGGAIKGIIMDLPIKDFDFILLTQEKENTLQFIKKYKLKYQLNGKHGYSFVYNNLLVGLSSTDDLGGSTYNTDFLFYDIHRKQFIPIGIKQALIKNQVIIYGYDGYPRRRKRNHMKARMVVAKKFINYMNANNKRVKVVGNFRYFCKLVLGFLKNPIKIIKLFR